MRRIDTEAPNSNGRARGGDPDGAAESGPASLADVVRELRSVRKAIEADHAKLLDRAAAAAMLGISTATFDRLRSSGAIPAPVELKGSGLLRYRREDLEKYIADL